MWTHLVLWLDEVWNAPQRDRKDTMWKSQKATGVSAIRQGFIQWWKSRLKAAPTDMFIRDREERASNGWNPQHNNYIQDPRGFKSKEEAVNGSYKDNQRN